MSPAPPSSQGRRWPAWLLVLVGLVAVGAAVVGVALVGPARPSSGPLPGVLLLVVAGAALVLLGYGLATGLRRRGPGHRRQRVWPPK